MKTNSLKNTTLSVFICIIASIICQAQTSNADFWNQVRYGGNLGVSFGTGYTAIQLAPQAIYQVNPFIGVGLGLNGSYVKRNFDRRDGFANDNLDYSSTILGGSIIGIANPIREIQLSADFEYLNVNQNFEDPQFRDDNYWVPALFLGAGYVNGPVTIGVRYDVLYDDGRSIYRNGLQPFVRVLF
ncbi:alpha-ketoglutarate decarboxylase [Nonlabens antarcticus]|uniref:alpha-ketoglutarate decarboxylase n=1 Tax=Nonlabens antarcticus TaxID=392714 RepID=UPI001891646B|nr:alpha-ketoglutarate decarboxylase [Nonlabens antarcticus]